MLVGKTGGKNKKKDKKLHDLCNNFDMCSPFSCIAPPFFPLLTPCSLSLCISHCCGLFACIGVSSLKHGTITAQCSWEMVSRPGIDDFALAVCFSLFSPCCFSFDSDDRSHTFMFFCASSRFLLRPLYSLS